MQEIYSLSQINIYPVKSLGGFSVASAFAGDRGLQYDRRWMITDENHVFITQREIPLMALIGTSLHDDGIYLYRKQQPEERFLIPFEVKEGEKIMSGIWKDNCESLHFSQEADEWLSDMMKAKCKLMYMPDSSVRPVEANFLVNNEQVSFADGFPYLIIGESSLQDLNNRLDEKIPMNRFRPNFVFNGGAPYIEDSWNNMQIGNVLFRATRPCLRCMITTIDQETATVNKEPLKTLATYRNVGNNIKFGMNVMAVTHGRIQTGDTIYMQEAK
ncbi:MAG: MOSC N-terminal beta barrel domain-containing protein [Bacteroidota bacterium]